MDGRVAREVQRALAPLIGEIMEDHVDLALAPPPSGDWTADLRRAGEDVATLASAIGVVERRSETA